MSQFTLSYLDLLLLKRRKKEFVAKHARNGVMTVHKQTVSQSVQTLGARRNILLNVHGVDVTLIIRGPCFRLANVPGVCPTHVLAVLVNAAAERSSAADRIIVGGARIPHIGVVFDLADRISFRSTRKLDVCLVRRK